MSGGADAFARLRLALARAIALCAELRRDQDAEAEMTLLVRLDGAVDDAIDAFAELEMDGEPSSMSRIAAFLDGEGAP